MRTTEEVLRDHLRLAREGAVEEDARCNYDPAVVCFIDDGIHFGHDGLRRLAHRLERELPGATFEYQNLLVHGDIAFLKWAATADYARVTDGADTYVVRDGRICVQTIHYTVQPRDDASGAS